MDVANLTPKQRRVKQIWGMLALCICGAAVYELPYLSWSYYDAAVEFYRVSNAQMGYLMTMYGLACVISYLPAGRVADKFQARHLIATALVSTGIFGLILTFRPPYVVLMICYVCYGFTTTIPLWSAMMKATRELGDSSEMGRLYGFLEGGRGFVPVLYGAVIIPIFSYLGEGAGGFRAILIYFVILDFVCAFFALGAIRKLRPDEEETQETETKHKHSFAEYLDMMKNKNLWLLTLLMFCCFMIYESYSYITPYLTNFFGVSESLGAMISLIKSYGLAVFGGIAVGFVADKIHSNPKVIGIGFSLMVIGIATFFVVPAEPKLLGIAAVTILVISLGLFMVRALYFAVIDEIKIPLKYTGMAVGFASVIGCLPQIFIYSITGNLLDAFPGIRGYRYMFAYEFAAALIGAILAFTLYRNIKKENSKNA